MLQKYSKIKHLPKSNRNADYLEIYFCEFCVFVRNYFFEA